MKEVDQLLEDAALVESVYDAQGKFIKEIKIPERPTSIVISNDDKTLYITSAGSLFSKNLE